MRTKRDVYQQCTYCVMDTSDPEIVFDASGRCNHCRYFDGLVGTVWKTGSAGQERLTGLLNMVRRGGVGREFDCILGLSGGVDSSYLAIKAREWGLRPLVVHVDAGWNSELAVKNIESVIRHTGFELHTHVVEWESMRRLQVAYLRSGIANQDVPQDHAFFAGLYRFATENGIRFVLNGLNVATEGIFPTSWQGPAMDAHSLRAIYRRFGPGRRLVGYPTVNIFQYYIWYPRIRRMTPVHPLNSMEYSQEKARNELIEQVGWRPYERKHGESIFTKFFQNYYLPQRFGYDKRRPHLSSRIAAGEISRSTALAILEEPLYDENELERDLNYICMKLELSREELEALLHAPLASYEDFPNWSRSYSLLKRGQVVAERVTGRSQAIYFK